LTHVSTPERKKIGIKNLDLWAENNPRDKKIRIDYMTKPNAKHTKTLEIKLALWLTPLLPPKDICGFKSHFD
jgi:hypothetical protein